MAETIFSKIVRGEVEAAIVYDDEHCLAFHDIVAQAPVHVLVIPKRPIESLEQLTDTDASLMGHIWTTIPKIARQLGVSDAGYRVVVNCGNDGGQSVAHLHFHILGGRQLKWPAG